MRSTTDHIEKLVAERHVEVKQALEALLVSIASNNEAAVKQANKALFDALEKLGHVIAREHWPDWLSRLRQQTSNYHANHNNGKATWLAHLKCVMQHYHEIQNHVWFSTPADDAPVFDVDRLIAAAKDEFKIDELFERVILTLKRLSELEELDSVKATRDLEEIIAILKKARTGSFAIQVFSWDFTKRYVPKLIGNYLRRSDITGPAIEAFEQTAEEMSLGLDGARLKISNDLKVAAANGFGALNPEQIADYQAPKIEDQGSAEVSE